MKNVFKSTLNKIPSVKLILFFSAYFPLVIIMGLKLSLKYEVYFITPYLNISFPLILVGTIVLVVVLLVLFKWIVVSSKSQNKTFIEIDKIEEKNYLILSYLVPYLFSSMSINTIDGVIGGVIIFLIILLIYINSEILYLNPIFLFGGYNFYNIYTERHHVLMISKIDLNREIGSAVEASKLTSRVYMVGDYDE